MPEQRERDSWRDLPPTPRQLQHLGTLLGWPAERAKGRTRGQISDAIAQLHAASPKPKREQDA